MASRHQSRTIALQTLYEIDFRGYDHNNFLELLEHNDKEFAHTETDKEYTKQLVDGILKKQTELDQIITKAAPEWPVEKIGLVDRNVLRMGLYELIYADKKEVPSRVAINEAIEVAKLFSTDSSGKFVNGVLGSVYRDIYKDEAEKPIKYIKDSKNENTHKKNNQDLTEEERSKLKSQEMIGVIVYAKYENQLYLALVNDVFGYWTLSKGKKEEGEKNEETAKRKVLDELGLSCIPGMIIDQNNYVAGTKEGEKVLKKVTYMLAESNLDPVTAKKEGGLKDASWFKEKDVFDLKLYEDMIPIIKKAISMINRD